MSNYKGQSGALILGGALVGSPVVNGALSESDTTVSMDAASLTGVVAVGDTFTLAGESGTPTHTVTGGPFYLAAGNAVTGVTFTPAIAAGGVGDGAAIAFAANSAGEIRSWELSAELDILETTVKGVTVKTYRGALASWRGSATALLDYDDTKQAVLIDEVFSGSPDGTIAALQFQVASGKTWYGAAELSNIRIESPEGPLVTVGFDFQGSGQVLPNWV